MSLDKKNVKIIKDIIKSYDGKYYEETEIQSIIDNVVMASKEKIQNSPEGILTCVTQYIYNNKELISSGLSKL